MGPLPPYRGGIAHFNTAVVRGLRRRGYAVDLVTFARQYPERLFPGVTQIEPGPVPDDVKAPRLLDPLNPLSWRRALRRVRAHGSQTVVLPYWMSFFAPMTGTLARAVQRRDVRPIGLVHNALSHEPRAGETVLARFALSALDGALVLSEEVRADVGRLAPHVPVEMAPHPVYDQFGDGLPQADARRRLGLPENGPVLLFFGFVRRYKGLHVLLDALPAIREAIPAVCLVVAGEFYDDETDTRAQIERLGLGEAVRIEAGYIPGEEVATYFSAADAVVQPYLSATQSGVAQIAFQFERPVVTTDVGGLAEVVPHGEAGRVVPPNDAQALAEAVITLLTADDREAMRAGVRRQREAHSWDAVLDAVEALAE